MRREYITRVCHELVTFAAHNEHALINHSSLYYALIQLTAREGALEYYLQFGKLNSMFGRHSSTRDRLEELFRPFLRRYTNAKVIAAAADYQYIQRFNLSGGGSSAFSSRQRMPAGARQFPLDNNMFNQHGASSHVGLQQPFFNIDDKFVDVRMCFSAQTLPVR